MKGMTTCKVCGRDFPLIFEEHYVAQDPQQKGLAAVISTTDKAYTYDAFDCPHCGCQNVMQQRKPTKCPCDYGICDECEGYDGEEEDENDDASEEPCSEHG